MPTNLAPDMLRLAIAVTYEERDRLVDIAHSLEIVTSSGRPVPGRVINCIASGKYDLKISDSRPKDIKASPKQTSVTITLPKDRLTALDHVLRRFIPSIESDMLYTRISLLIRKIVCGQLVLVPKPYPNDPTPSNTNDSTNDSTNGNGNGHTIRRGNGTSYVNSPRRATKPQSINDYLPFNDDNISSDTVIRTTIGNNPIALNININFDESTDIHKLKDFINSLKA